MIALKKKRGESLQTSPSGLAAENRKEYGRRKDRGCREGQR